MPESPAPTAQDSPHLWICLSDGESHHCLLGCGQSCVGCGVHTCETLDHQEGPVGRGPQPPFVFLAQAPQTFRGTWCSSALSFVEVAFLLNHSLTDGYLNCFLPFPLDTFLGALKKLSHLTRLLSILTNKNSSVHKEPCKEWAASACPGVSGTEPAHEHSCGPHTLGSLLCSWDFLGPPQLTSKQCVFLMRRSA